MSSISKNQLKELRALHVKKYRQARGLFIAEGDKNIGELLQSEGWDIVQLYALPTWAEQNHLLLRAYRHCLSLVSEKELADFSALSTPSSVAAVVKIPVGTHLGDIHSSLSLVLDRLNDPGNLGTIIRIADWFGIRHVFCSPDSVDVFNPKTVQAAMGSLWRVRVIYMDIKLLFSQYKELPVYGAVLNGNNLFETTTTTAGFVLLGSESHGIQADLLPYITQKITIPRFGQAESLNVAVAAGIIAARFRQ